MPNDSEDFKLRAYSDATDRAYVYDSWFNGWRDNGRAYRDVPPPVFTHHASRIIDHHLEHSSILVLSGDSYTNWVAGYIIGTITEASPLVHYAYVRKTYRGHGLGTRLVQAMLSLHPVEGDVVYHTGHTTASAYWERTHKGQWRDGEMVPGTERETHWLERRWLYNPWGMEYGMKGDWYL